LKLENHSVTLASRNQSSLADWTPLAKASHPEKSKDKSLMQRFVSALYTRVPEVWVRFLVALFGLAIAFACAVFSTVARDAGNVGATIVLSVCSLVLALIIGVSTIPYLFRRVAVSRVREAFDYEVTRAGVAYLALALVLGLAGLNTGNNLLYVVVSAMLAAFVVSGIASALVLRKLELEFNLPGYAFAGKPLLARAILRNPRQWLPSFSITLVPPKRRKPGVHWQPSVFAFPPHRSPERQWLRLPDLILKRSDEKPRPPIMEGSIYFPYIPAGHSLSATMDLRFPRRGVYQQAGFGLATRFPFSFLTKTRRLPLAKQLMVFPSVEPTDELFEVLPLITGEFESFVRGRGFDLYRIRNYGPEDSARHVDWKASAKAGSLLVREFTREDERKLRIVFDNPAPDVVTDVAYERAVSLAASLAWHFAATQAQLSFAAPGCDPGADIYGFLGYLADVKPQPSPSVLETLSLSDDYNLVFTARARGSIPTPLWARSYFLFIYERR
jgi:uncharacterized protein (DUF58 family)